jgi:hypothetical protein
LTCPFKISWPNRMWPWKKERSRSCMINGHKAEKWILDLDHRVIVCCSWRKMWRMVCVFCGLKKKKTVRNQSSAWLILIPLWHWMRTPFHKIMWRVWNGENILGNGDKKFVLKIKKKKRRKQTKLESVCVVFFFFLKTSLLQQVELLPSRSFTPTSALYHTNSHRCHSHRTRNQLFVRTSLFSPLFEWTAAFCFYVVCFEFSENFFEYSYICVCCSIFSP